ncbi:serine/threonine protein kinase [Brenneria goodwinii]|uniref:Stress response kinase A n=1 Tax=Brenneria goodwinii TaxID=1109412 RepID=A0A0G4JT00_9GAMM|nr:serine/threonine protein kinase [Brenneria goodwinii]MCG8155860.1 serine/threonine protein kinase [Brenneria goodwinii]MCG8162253.1 serine/threonine protein kinase [Brenneria goodwinii]MCG8167026.1 serine/threonine protein kinase [Brenneria goodwinii]MCG8169700.1 serine/threonine protein kinase [Brenneria goodwinii]MCG8174694.1 serine/threonine protein kinase [Brenneria goodwinii]
MNSSVFNFQTLFPELIMDALLDAGIRVDSGLTALNSYENRVYQFTDEDRKRFVVKFYRPERWSTAQIMEEHAFASELADDEVPIVAPLALNGHTLHLYDGFHFAVFPSVGGRQYEMDNEDQLEWVGRFLGRIHQVGRRSSFLERPTIGLNEYLHEPYRLLESCPLIPKTYRNAFLQATSKLIDTVEVYWRTDWQSIRLHGDCHPGNILWRDGPLFVDLDDARNGPAIQDLWMLLHGERREQRIQLDILLEAYSEFAEFQDKELALIEPLRAMRQVHYLAWIIRRWEDPAFPRNFPWIKDADFWLKQTSIFTEQVKLLQEPPLQLMPMY